MRYWSPGARVGQAWLNVAAIKGTFGGGPASGVLGKSGIDNGIWGFTVADVGSGGSDKTSDVKPGMSSATTFSMSGAFFQKYEEEFIA